MIEITESRVALEDSAETLAEQAETEINVQVDERNNAIEEVKRDPTYTDCLNLPLPDGLRVN